MDLQKPQVIEIHVRMDCNGCVHKIKKALHGINGIYDLYIDFPQQKLTIIGWADPERILKAIRKTRKIATICSHTEQPDDPAAQPTPTPTPTEPPPPPEQPDASNPIPPEGVQAAETPPSPVVNEMSGQQVPGHRQAYVTYHHHPDYNYIGYPPPPPMDPSPSPMYQPQPHPHPHRQPQPAPAQTPPSPSFIYKLEPYSAPSPTPPSASRPVYVTDRGVGYEYPQDPPPAQMHPTPSPMYVTHSYNTHRPSTYVTEYEYIPPIRQQYNTRNDYEYQMCSSANGNGNGNITSMFSDENPNACKIV